MQQPSMDILAFQMGWMGFRGLFVPLGLFLMAGAILLRAAWGFYHTRKSLLSGFHILAVLMMVFLIVTPYFVMPQIEKKKLSTSFAQKIRASMKEDDLIVTHPFSVPNLVFYANHRVMREKKTHFLEAFLRSSQYHRFFLLTKAERLGLIRQTWKGKVKVLGGGESIYPHGKLVLLLLSPGVPSKRSLRPGN